MTQAKTPDFDAMNEWKPDMDELDGEEKPDLTEKKPRARSVKGKAKAAASAGSGGKWTGDEDWALFQAIFPRATKIDWSAISASVGRDAKVSSIKSLCFSRRRHSQPSQLASSSIHSHSGSSQRLASTGRMEADLPLGSQFRGSAVWFASIRSLLLLITFPDRIPATTPCVWPLTTRSAAPLRDKRCGVPEV